MARIAVLGSITMDLVFRIPRLPLPGETLFADSFELLDGGKGLNQAIAAARLEAQASLIGCVGEDAFGERLLAAATRDGVDTSHVTRDRVTPTAIAVPMVLPSGENVIVAAPGANGRVSVAHIRAAAGAIEAADVLLLQFETPMATVAEAARIARLAGRLVLLNPAPARPIPPELLACADILVLNEVEAAALAAGRTAEAQAHFLAIGRRAAVVTLGPSGGVWAEGGQTHLFAAHPVRAIDTVGAGDAFCGALGTALAGRLPMAEAIAFANAAAAISVTRAGAAPSLPNRPEVLALLAR